MKTGLLLNMDESNEKVTELSNASETKVNANDASIGEKPGERSVLVRFARRAGKQDNFRTK